MSRKSKGINAERELIHLFWNNGWTSCRVAGSGSSHYPSPDIIAGKINRKLAIECKACKNTSQYLTNEEITQLKTFSQLFGAEPWVAVKFNKLNWFFLTLEDINKAGNNFVVTTKSAKNKGILFEELIK